MVDHLASHALSIAHREAEKDHYFYVHVKIILEIGEKIPSGPETSKSI